MKKRILAAIMLTILFVACFTACGSMSDLLSEEYSNGVDIVDSSYEVDKESGLFEIKVTVKNNSDKTFEFVELDSIGYDSEGNVINEKEFTADNGDHMSRMLSVAVYGLDPDETEDVTFTGGIDNDVEYNSILDYFEDIPDRIEWVTVPHETMPDFPED